MYLESEEWAVENPRDWVVILAEMRKNVQSRAASVLGHVPPHLSDHRPPPNSKQSGSKVYPCCSHRCLPSELIKLYDRASFRQHRAI
jgi:hypothetical protein